MGEKTALNMKSRYALVGVISTPLLFIAGAGAALFWTLGVTGNVWLKLRNFFENSDIFKFWKNIFLATLIGGHASFRNAVETPDPFAEEV